MQTLISFAQANLSLVNAGILTALGGSILLLILCCVLGFALKKPGDKLRVDEFSHYKEQAWTICVLLLMAAVGLIQLKLAAVGRGEMDLLRAGHLVLVVMFLTGFIGARVKTGFANALLHKRYVYTCMVGLTGVVITGLMLPF